MLQSFEIEGFKSYNQATLLMTDPDRDGGQSSPLTVLIGANASGKTNLIEGLRLLSSIAGGVRLDTIRPGPTDADLRGSLRGLVHRKGRRFTFGCRTDFEEYERYAITLELREDDRLHIVEESVSTASRKVPLSRWSSRPKGWPATSTSPTTTSRAAARSRSSPAPTRSAYCPSSAVPAVSNGATRPRSDWCRCTLAATRICCRTSGCWTQAARDARLQLPGRDPA